MRATGYYNEQMQTDERLAAFMKDIYKRLRKGEQFSRGRNCPGIAVARELKDSGLGSKWSGFVRSFDYTRRISEGRISKERHAWQEREAVRLALRQPFKACEKYGIPSISVVPMPKPLVRPAVPTDPAPRVNVVLADIRLRDWSFTNGMGYLLLHWDVKNGKDMEAFTTKHELEPQVYARVVAGKDAEGEPVIKRKYVSGDFRQGSLTKEARVRVINEGREAVAKALPGLNLERYKDTLGTMDHIMR